jgi:hypothetical protein
MPAITTPFGPNAELTTRSMRPSLGHWVKGGGGRRVRFAWGRPGVRAFSLRIDAGRVRAT